MGDNKIKRIELKRKSAQEEIADQNKYLDDQMTEEWLSKSWKEKKSVLGEVSLYILLAGWLVATTCGIIQKCSTEVSWEKPSETQKSLLTTLRDNPVPYIYKKQDSIHTHKSLHPDSLAQDEGDIINVVK